MINKRVYPFFISLLILLIISFSYRTYAATDIKWSLRTDLGVGLEGYDYNCVTWDGKNFVIAGNQPDTTNGSTNTLEAFTMLNNTLLKDKWNIIRLGRYSLNAVAVAQPYESRVVVGELRDNFGQSSLTIDRSQYATSAINPSVKDLSTVIGYKYQLSSVAYGGANKFVIVGGSDTEKGVIFCINNNEILSTELEAKKCPISPDGWLNAVTWGGNKFVAVGYDSGIYTSSDGMDWTKGSITTSMGKSRPNLNSVVWGENNRFVAVGDSGTILTSSNGMIWTKVNISKLKMSMNLKSVAWGQDRFVAVGENGVVITSENGTDWKSNDIGLKKTAVKPDFMSIVWNGRQFVAVGSNKTILVSTPNNVDIMYGDKIIKFDDNHKPVIINGSNYVPLVYTTNELGLSVVKDTTSVTIKKFNSKGETVNTITYKIKEEELNANGEIIRNYAKSVRNYTYVPIKFFENYMGYKIEYDSATKTVLIGD